MSDEPLPEQLAEPAAGAQPPRKQNALLKLAKHSSVYAVGSMLSRIEMATPPP